MPLVSKAFGDIITFTRASTGSYFDSAGVLQSAAINAPRLDYNPSTLAARGLLIEEQRTNSIRNNTMVGAVAGTPGTNPTNWAYITAGTGLTKEIVGIGTESGIAYIDVRASGTAGSTAALAVSFDTAVAAATAQVWANSLYWRLVGGSTAGITTATTGLIELTSGRVFVAGAYDNQSTPTSASLKSQRVGGVRTLSGGATVAILDSVVAINCTNGAAIDITLRIGLPQLEQGAFATSVIPTTTAAVTRSADEPTVNTLAPWYNALQSTLYGEWTNIAATMPTGSTQIVVQLNNAGNTSQIRLFQVATANAKASQNMINLNDNPGRIDSGGAYSNATVKAAAAFAASDRAVSANNAAPTTSATGTVPAVTLMVLGHQVGQAYLNGWLRRVTYYPRRLSDAELQTITT